MITPFIYISHSLFRNMLNIDIDRDTHTHIANTRFHKYRISFKYYKYLDSFSLFLFFLRFYTIIHQISRDTMSRNWLFKKKNFKVPNMCFWQPVMWHCVYINTFLCISCCTAFKKKKKKEAVFILMLQAVNWSRTWVQKV